MTAEDLVSIIIADRSLFESLIDCDVLDLMIMFNVDVGVATESHRLLQQWTDLLEAVSGPDYADLSENCRLLEDLIRELNPRKVQKAASPLMATKLAALEGTVIKQLMKNQHLSESEARKECDKLVECAKAIRGMLPKKAVEHLMQVYQVPRADATIIYWEIKQYENELKRIFSR